MQRQGLLLSFILLFGLTVSGQTLHRQSLGSQGVAVALPSGVVVSQSIGQQSITGNAMVGDVRIIQGFQQSSSAIRFITAGLPSSTSLRAFPNPFSDQLNFQFDTEVTGDIKILVYDSAGRLVSSKETRARDSRAQVELSSLQSGLYHLELISNGQKFHTTVIRK